MNRGPNALLVVFACTVVAAVSHWMVQSPQLLSDLQIANKYEARFKAMEEVLRRRETMLVARMEQTTNAIVLKNCRLTSTGLPSLVVDHADRFVLIIGCRIGDGFEEETK